MQKIKKFLPALYDVFVTLVSFYLFFRMREWGNIVFGFETGYIFGIIAAVYLFLNIFMIQFGFFSKSKVMTYIVSIWTFVFMYLSMSVVVCDIVRLISCIFTKDTYFRERMLEAEGYICILTVIGFIIYGCMKVKKPVKVYYSFECKNLSHDMRIVLLSDLHIGFFVGEKHIKKVVDIVNELDADNVLIAGDIINAGNTEECAELTKVSDVLKTMKSKEGTFAVTGNHDPDPNEDEFGKFLRNSNITLLQDEIYDNGICRIAGRSTVTKTRKALDEITALSDNSKPLFVIDHDPRGIKEAKESNAALVMCGHTHKGQVFPLNLFVRLVYNSEEFGGFSKSGETAVAVSAGAGYFSMPMRVGSDCEIVCIDIKSV